MTKACDQLISLTVDMSVCGAELIGLAGKLQASAVYAKSGGLSEYWIGDCEKAVKRMAEALDAFKAQRSAPVSTSPASPDVVEAL